MATKTIKRSINITPEMRDLLAQLAARRGREVCEADLIREAIRQYLDEQADVVGSRRHFQKSLQARIDRLETGLAFHLNVLVYLMANALSDARDDAIADALIAAHRDGAALLKQIDALLARQDDR
ncbi:MAG: hypothetical protein SF123_11305 [Chloroflexota bacterium]|nr:hypothetical protein [Chloroflexota bacterium]